MMQPYSEGTFDDVAKYKFEQAEDDLEAAKILLHIVHQYTHNEDRLFLGESIRYDSNT